MEHGERFDRGSARRADGGRRHRGPQSLAAGEEARACAMGGGLRPRPGPGEEDAVSPLAAGSEVQMTEHAIRYRRPETPHSLSRMTTQSAAEAAHQVDRLIALGYVVQDVTPPLTAPAEDA